MCTKPKFVIVSPRQNYGGPIAIHNLCRILTSLGYDSKIFYGDVVCKPGKKIKSTNVRIIWQRVKFLSVDTAKLIIVRILGNDRSSRFVCLNGYVNVPINGCKRKWLPFVDKETIVVYPDGSCGNYLRADNVVRWLLYFNRFKGEENVAYGKKDLFFAYSPVFNDEYLNPTCRVLRTPYFDMNLYRQTNFKSRSGTCYIIRKGKTRDDLPTRFKGIVIDNLSEKDKVRVFNECEICISYDTHTAYSSIASICGCVSIVVLEPGADKTKYMVDGKLPNGVAFGFEIEEIERALRTKEELREEYRKLDEESIVSTKLFVNECKSYFFGG